MLEPEKISRINFLAKKSKSQGLTDDEKQEQAALRNEYLASLRQGLTATLENMSIKEPDGSIRKVKKIEKK